MKRERIETIICVVLYILLAIATFYYIHSLQEEMIKTDKYKNKINQKKIYKSNY